MGCYTYLCSFQDTRPSLSEQDIERGNKKPEMDELSREYMKGRVYKNQEMWECEVLVVGAFQNRFFSQESRQDKMSLKRPLSTDSFLERIKKKSFFGCVQCDLIVPDKLEPAISNFPPILKNNDVCRNDIGE